MAMSEALQASKKAIIVGATGAVGKEVLAELLRTDHFAQVHSFGRRASGQEHPKLVEHIVDFEKLADGDEAEASKLRQVGADATIITLGTTKAEAGSAARFERIDREYVVAAAKAARSEAQTDQRLVYLCSAGANPRLPSLLLYPRSKGLTELALDALAFPSSYTFRPGFLYGAERSKPRRLEAAFGLFTHHILSKVSSGAEVHVPLLAKAIVSTAAGGQAFCQSRGVQGAPLTADEARTTTVISNAEIVTLSGQ
ncbi:unnamed protein product [Parajaminaea phylloscopi]